MKLIRIVSSLLILILGTLLQAQFLIPMPAITDEPPNPNEPIIRLPNMPGNSPNQPGTAPRTGPGNNNGGVGVRPPVTEVRPVMSSVGRGAFPNMSCPLTDNRPHQDLVAAVNSLARVVVITPECQNNVDINRVLEDVQKMAKASTELGSLWEDPSKINQSPSSLNMFQGNLNDMINGLNRVTGTLQNSAFLNSQCGQNLLTGTGILTSVSDIVSSFAPFALVGAAMNPSLKIALPYILGITGVGSVAKIIQSLKDKQSFVMDRPEHRQAVLDNICEFSKISRRVRFLQMAQSGQIDLITSELQQYETQNQTLLRSEFGTKVFEIKKIETDYRLILGQFDQRFNQFQSELENLQKDLKGGTKDFICMMGQQIAQPKSSDMFPNYIIATYKNILGYQTQSQVFQATLVATEANTRSRLVRMKSSDGQCADVATTYFQILDRLVQNGKQSVAALNRSLHYQLRQDNQYKQFSSREETVMSEIRFLSRIKNLLEQLNLKNAVIDKMELDTRINELRRALFSQGGIGLLGRGDSPAASWLKFAWDQHLRSSQQFDLEFQELAKDVLAASRTGRTDFVRRDSKGNVIKDRWGRPVPKSAHELNRDAMTDAIGATELNLITPKVAAPGTPNHSILCRRLESIWISWAASMDHLSASQFFCDFIAQYFDSRTQGDLVQHCEGRMDVAGRVITHSNISQRVLQLQSSQARKRAELVSQKMTELHCPKPTAEVLKDLP